MKERFVQQRLVKPTLELLRQGVTPEKIALSVALGLTLGVFPVLGATTALCAIAALALGLNLPAIQMVNYLVYPLQIALLLPFFRLGEELFHAPHLPLSLFEIRRVVRADAWAAMRMLWASTWHAVIGWCLVAPLFTLVTYRLLLPVLKRMLRKQTPHAAEAV